MKIFLHTLLIIAITLSSVASHAAELCSDVFFEGPYHDAVLDAALKKAIGKDGSIKGLSSHDLDFLIEKIFDKQEEPQFQISDYWTKSAEERTFKVVARQVSQEVVHKGLVQYFQDHGLLVDHSRLLTKLRMLHRHKIFDAIQASWLTISTVTKGIPPVLLPEIVFKMKEADRNALLLKGLDSAEGKEIISRYGLRQEAIRGYTLFSKNYSRLALAVLVYVVFDKTMDHLQQKEQKESDDAFTTLLKHFQDLYGVDTTETKEDILFDTVIKKFHAKYNRLPSKNEKNLICLKVYGQEGCPK